MNCCTPNPEPLTYDQFIAAYPEFSEVPPAAVEAQLTISNCFLKFSVLGVYWQLLVGLHAAHYLALRYNISANSASLGINGPTSGIGATNSKSASNTSLSEGTTLNSFLTSTNPVEADFGRTGYGIQFLSLLYTVVPAGYVLKSIDSSLAAVDRW